MFNIKSCEVGVELNCCTALISQDLNLIRSWVLITFICPLWSRLIVIFSVHREKRAGNSSSSFSQTCFIAAKGQRLVKNWSGSIERWKLLLQIWSGLRKKSGIDIKISWRWKLLYFNPDKKDFGAFDYNSVSYNSENKSTINLWHFETWRETATA